MEEMTDFLERRIAHAKKRVEQIKIEHGSNPNETHNYFGGESLGYWKGLLAAYTNILEKIN